MRWEVSSIIDGGVSNKGEAAADVIVNKAVVPAAGIHADVFQAVGFRKFQAPVNDVLNEVMAPEGLAGGNAVNINCSRMIGILPNKRIA